MREDRRDQERITDERMGDRETKEKECFIMTLKIYVGVELVDRLF